MKDRKMVRRILSFVLAALMILSTVPVMALGVGAEETQTESGFMRIFHLDCGRKYFSVSEIEGIIDQLSENNYTHLQLAFGNDGFRFLLDDMSVSGYTSSAVVTAVQAGNDAYDATKSYNPSTDELTQAEMDTIFAYAKSKNIEIIPLINTPGHMYTLVYAMYKLGIRSSTGTELDLSFADETAFIQALLEKYAAYFADAGCKYFHIGADESSYSGGDLATYVNSLDAIVKNAGMTAIAFNDGITVSDGFNTDILVSYWTDNGDKYTSVSELTSAGFKIINCNNAWYYVLGDYLYEIWSAGQWGYADSKAALQSTDVMTLADGQTGATPIGSVLCVWCDGPSKSYATYQAKVYDLIATMADNNPTYFTAASSDPGTETVPGDDTGSETEPSEGPSEPSDIPADAIKVTVSVGQTVIADTLAGKQELTAEGGDASIAGATVSAVVDQPGQDEVKESWTKNTSISNGSTYIIGTGSGYIKLDGTTIFNVTDPKEATEFTIEKSGNSYRLKSGSYYLRHATNSLSVGTNTRNASWSYSSTKGFYYTNGWSSYYSYYLRLNSSTWEVSTTNSNNGFAYTYVPGQAAVEETYKTEISFTGVSVGTTLYVIGGVTYAVTVVPEDLAGVADLPIQLWITNVPIAVSGVTSATSGSYRLYSHYGSETAYYVPVSASDAYGEAGVLLSELVPVAIIGGTETTIDNKDADQALWKGTVLKNSSTATPYGLQAIWTDDMSSSGTDYRYVRYYNGGWAVSFDRTTWTTVTGEGSTAALSDCVEQVIAYYLQRTKVTNEVLTDVKDWGNTKDQSAWSDTTTSFVLLDYAVKYEDGSLVPDAFSNDNTVEYHCVHGNSVVGQDADGNYYRYIGNTFVRDTADYEVYMITVTPIADDKSVTLGALNTVDSYSYDGTEKVIWVDDVVNLGKFADTNLQYHSPSGEYNFTVGGDAGYGGIEIYEGQAMLVTYYIRAKQTEDSLKVVYVDESFGSTLYEYHISVKAGVTFDPTLDDEGRFDASSLTIENLLGVTQNIETDLNNLPEISSRYDADLYSYQLSDLSEDGKTLYLYYTMDTTVFAATIVMDFAKPVSFYLSNLIPEADPSIWDVIPGKATYGTLAYDSTTGKFTYTQTRPARGMESLSIQVKGKAGNSYSTINVGVLAATNIYVEDDFSNFITYTGDWTYVAGSNDGQSLTLIQGGSSIFGDDVYGYEKSYSEDKTFSSDGYHSVVAISGTDKPTASFTFWGTGFDIISRTGADQGLISVEIVNSDGKTVKKFSVLNKGDVELYQIPVISVQDLDYAQYTVTITVTLHAPSPIRTAMCCFPTAVSSAWMPCASTTR